jgi:hypothetical protein
VAARADAGWIHRAAMVGEPILKDRGE